MNNTTYKSPNGQNVLIEDIGRVDANMWKNFINHTKKEEDSFWEIDDIVDEVLAVKLLNLTITITGNRSS